MEKSKIQKAEETFKVIAEIQALKGNVVLNFLEIGKRLVWLQKREAWRDYATHIHNWGDLLKEIGMKRSTAYHSMKAFQLFGVQRLDITERRLIQLLPVVDKKNREEWIEKAKQYPEEQWEQEIRRAKGKPFPAEYTCLHPIKNILCLFKCQKCSHSWKPSLKEIQNYALFKSGKKKTT